jgi:hypothetical protein
LLVDLGEARLRLAPSWIVVPLDHLPPRERARAMRHADAFGVLKPVRGDGAPRIVDADAALLAYSLQSPGALPRRFDEVQATLVRGLILDGILELETDRGFVSGHEAEIWLGEAGDLGAAATATSEVSLAALFDAEASGEEVPGLAHRLYRFGRAARTPERAAAYDRAGWSDYVGLGPDGAWPGDWSPLAAELGGRGWRQWYSGRAAANAVTCKLYLALAPEDLAEGLPPAVECLAEAGALSFKVGSDLGQLLRPDRVVAYFAAEDRLFEAAARIEARLSGMDARPVPFTAALDAAGLASWGRDPPRGGDVSSWRLEVAHVLAEALARARGIGLRRGAAVGFALRRARAEGLDVSTWTPPAELRS